VDASGIISFGLGLRLIFTSYGPTGAQYKRQFSRFAAAGEGMIANLVNPWPITFTVAFLNLSIPNAPTPAWCNSEK
jgi:threonine/homoserine/homoserine lactone efflux protein